MGSLGIKGKIGPNWVSMYWNFNLARSRLARRRSAVYVGWTYEVIGSGKRFDFIGGMSGGRVGSERGRHCGQ